jgi:O-antigen/teichoic acid export membrane protein
VAAGGRSLSGGRLAARVRSWRALLPLAAMRSSVQLLVGTATAQLGIFAAGVLVARAEGVRSYGLYAAAFALASLTVGGATAGLPILLFRRSAERNVAPHTLRRAVELQSAFSLLAVFATAAVGGFFGGWEGSVAAGAAGLFFAANNMATMGQNVQSGRRRYHRAAATDVAAGVLFPILTLAALTLGTGIAGCLVAIALACAISCSIAWTGLPAMDFDREPSPLRTFDGLSFTAFGLAKAGYGRLDTFTLAAVAGGTAAGYYSAAYRLLGPFDLLGAAFVSVYFSRVSEHSSDREQWLRIRRRGRIVLAGVAACTLAVLFVAAPLVIDVFYGPEFQRAVGPARILLLSVVPWALYWPRTADLASVHLEGRATIALALGFLVDLVLVIAVADRYGATGAAWAWVASEWVMLIGVCAMSRGIVDRVGLRAGPEPAPQPGFQV